MRGCFIIILCLLSNLLFCQDNIPEFKDYIVKELKKNKSVELLPSTIKVLKKIKLGNGDTALDYVKEEVNYAGHYEIVEWNCGAPCLQAIVIDYETGKIIGNISACYELEYQLESSLIKADDVEDDTLCSVKYLTIKNNKIIQLEL